MDQTPRLELIAKLEGQIHDCLKEYVSSDMPLAIVDFPDIKNCGDSAIWAGEISYLKKYFNGKIPDYVSRMKDFSAASLRRKVPEGTIFIHGGGNFGDIWLGHQVFRENVLEKFKGRQVVQFPQSIHFNDPKRIDAAARAIDQHGNFVLLVRDQESYDFSEKHFNCKVALCPDMAFAIGPISRPKIDIPVLAMLREDSEKVSRQESWNHPDIPKEDWITEDASLVDRVKREAWLSAITDMTLGERKFRMLNAAANQRLMDRGIGQISRAQAIVTDRLHVHICSMLLGRPHAVLDNSYGKIRRYMAAFSGGTEFSYQASSLEDAVDWARAQAEISVLPA